MLGQLAAIAGGTITVTSAVPLYVLFFDAKA
jgi:hypothetical protein